MAQGGMSLDQQFMQFSKFGNAKADGKTITLTNVDKWLKQANVIGYKKITITDTGITFNKFKKSNIDFPSFQIFLADLAEQKDIDVSELEKMLMECGLPGTSKTVKTVTTVVVTT